MAEFTERDALLAQAVAFARTQAGGTLATMHAEDGTPYVTFVLFHMRDDGSVLFGSGRSPQHSRNIDATPEVSFLVDNREVVRSDWTAFQRVVIEGLAERVTHDDPQYSRLAAELASKTQLATFFTEQGSIYRIRPRRLVVMTGIEPRRAVIDFEHGD
jgi:nitroimidazol reductase NimA-like FMN-containing flavoprotein (pyridoxamine 5'-phosphate oxidase superfamily)